MLCPGVLNQGLCAGVYVRQSCVELVEFNVLLNTKFSFQNPFSCNRKRHCTLYSNSTRDYVLGVSSGLATDGGSDPGDLCPPVVTTITSALLHYRSSQTTCINMTLKHCSLAPTPLQSDKLLTRNKA